MIGMGNYSYVDYDAIKRRVRACDYLTVAQLFLKDNFLLERELSPDDIKPRLLGHWGTCHGINVAYANLQAYFNNRLRPSLTSAPADSSNSVADPPSPAPSFHFVLGPGHGFPALQANLYLDGELQKVDTKATHDYQGLEYLCKSFSWPGGYPSHSSPATPGVICEGGELGYALATAYGAALGHPERVYAVLIGDGELETATALASLNLVKLLATEHNGLILPILHLNGYKISAPTIYGRKSERELHQLLRGFGYEPIEISRPTPKYFQKALREAVALVAPKISHPESPELPDPSESPEPLKTSRSSKTPNSPRPFLILHTEKGETGPRELNGHKIAGSQNAHQIPLPHAATDTKELQELEFWLKSYRFRELFNPEKGFTL